MNKKLLTAFLFGASVLASTSTFVSCKDYDDDIKAVQNNLDAEVTARKALEEKVTAAQTAITALQGEVAKIKEHEDYCDAAVAKAIQDAKDNLQAAIKEVSDKEAKDVVTLNAKIDQALIDAKAYTDAAIALQAEKDAATYATITDVNKQIKDVLDKYQTLSDEIAAVKGEYGSLKAALDAQKAALEKAIKDGDDATLKAAKEAVEAAKKELEAHETECDKKVNDALTEIYKAFDAENGTLAGLKNAFSTMTVDIKTLINYADELKTKTIPGIEEDIKKVDEKLALMTKVLSSQLRSLVFMPYLYVDGIEATRYRVLADTVLKKEKHKDIQRKRADYEDEIGCKPGTTDKGQTDWYTLTNIYDYVEPSPAKVVFFGPVWPVDYHANPTSANVQFSEVKGFKVLTPEVITRAGSESDLGVTAEEFYPDGTKVFNNNRNGELVVGIKVKNPQWLFDSDPDVVVNYNPELNPNPWQCKYCGHMYYDVDSKANENGPQKNCPECGKNGWILTEIVESPNAYESGTGHYSYGYDNTVALQVYEEDYTTEKISKDTITSDYALLYGTKVLLDGIVWNDKVGTKTNDGKLDGKGYQSPYSCVNGYSRQVDTDEWWYDATGRSGMKQDEAHPETGVIYRCGQHRHVYDTPEEALFDKNPVMLQWNNKDGIKLEDYLALHWYEENVNRTNWSNIYETNFTDKTSDIKGAGNPWKQYGLTYDFEFCNYQFGSNKTSDSKYAYWKDNESDLNVDKTKEDGYFSPTGTVIAGSCKTSNEYATIGDDFGERLTTQNRQSVHREPLVRVRVKHGTDVLLDGYILLHITDVIPDPTDTEIGFKNAISFDLCNDAKALAVDWQDFTDEFLAQLFATNPEYKDGVSKITFDDWFGADAVDAATELTNYPGEYVYPTFKGAADGNWKDAQKLANGGYIFDCDLFASMSETAVANKGTYGRVEYRQNESGVGNHEFVWYLTAEELEEITHHKADNKGTISTYIRWTGKSGSPYHHLWAKLTVDVTRVDIIKYGLAEKDINYWYCAKDGAIDKTGDDAYKTPNCAALSATLFNVETPKDGRNTQDWVVKQLNNWVGNEVFLVDSKTKKLATSGSANLATLDETITSKTINVKDAEGNVVTANEATKTKVVNRAKFYFTPDTMVVVVNDPTLNTGSVYTGDKIHNTSNTAAKTKYYITPQRSANDKEWNALIPRYYTHKLAANAGVDHNATITPSKSVYFKDHDNDLATQALPTCKLDNTIHYYNRDAKAYTKENEQDFEDFENKWNNSCAIDYNAGAYTNKDLYATTNFVKFTKIAEMDQQTGVLTLIHYDEIDNPDEYKVMCDVVNAVGYDNNSKEHHHNNINRELRAKIGIIAYDKCDLATQMDNSTWLGSWERPININPIADDEVIDGNQKNNANFIYLADILNLYDWRGPVKGEMNSRTNKWLWAYYNVHYITVDLNPDVVRTNLHIEGEKVVAKSEDVSKWTQLNKIDKYVRLFADSAQTTIKRTFNFDLHGENRYDKAVYTPGHYDPNAPLANDNSNIEYERNFNCGHENSEHNINNSSWSKCSNSARKCFNFATRSSELYDIMKSPKYTYVNKSTQHHDGSYYLEDVKAKFGYIWYDNNLDNVTEFWVEVPITVGYEWGCVTERVRIKIHPTEGNTGDDKEKSAKKRK